MATPRNVRVFVGKMEIDPSETTKLEDVRIDSGPSATIKVADGTWLEFRDTAEDNEKESTTKRHRVAVSSGGVLQVIVQHRTTWHGHNNVVYDEDAHEERALSQSIAHEIVKVFAPAAWREVDGMFAEWLPASYEEKSTYKRTLEEDGK